MNMSNRKWATLVLCTVLIAGIVSAQDWPQWRGANRDGKATGFTAPATWPKELKAQWKVAVGPGDSTPALVGDKLFVFTRDGAEEVILCLNAADGKEVWHDKYPAPAVTGAAGRHPGPRSSPTVADGKVVTLGVGGTVSCLDAASGKVLWRKDDASGSVPKFFTSMSPIIADGLAIAHVGGEGKGQVIAYELANGNAKWKWAGEGPGYASPVLMTADGVKQVVIETEKSVVGLAVADGKLLWQAPFAPSGMGTNAATPIIDRQTVIVTGQGRGTKAFKIAKEGDTFAAKELWSGKTGTVFNTPVLKDGKLFGISEGGFLYCMNAADGKDLWTTSDKLDRFGAVIDGGSCLLALSTNSQLIAYEPSDKEYKELAKIKVSDKQIYAHPVVAGKRIFVRDADSLSLLTTE
jgi:outer membrane protein assembly factor BamB